MISDSKMISIKRIYLFLLLAGTTTVLSSCSKDDSEPQGNGGNPPPDGQLMDLEYTSNADTLFLSWELLHPDMKFTRYRFSAGEGGSEVEVEANRRSCFLTDIPYNELVPVTVDFLNGDEVIRTAATEIMIDGLDAVFASTLIPDRGSVTGGDGTYSIALPDGRSLFLMGDSYIGPVSEGSRSMQDHMFRNTYILYDEGEVEGLYGVNGPNTSAAVPPGVTNEHQKWYWPGHGFTLGDKVYVFQTLMYQGAEGMWGFRYEKTDILEYQLPDMSLVGTHDIPFTGPEEIHYGMAALREDPYIYIYAQVDVDNGLDPLSDALVARTTPANLYTAWEYYDGTGWSPNSADAVKMEGLSAVPVSSQFNVFKLQDKYVLLTQNKQFGSGEIYTFISDTPQGPWYNRKLIYTTKEQQTPGLFTYNAMAHPQFKRDGRILISYNINNESFEEQHKDVSTYRPKFFWVETKQILNN